MKKIVLLFLILIAPVPALVSAESISQEAENKFEVLNSDSAGVPTPQETPKKKIKKRQKKTAPYEDSTKNQISMTEEEQQIMQAGNKMDGYRTAPRKPDLTRDLKNSRPLKTK